MKLGAPQIIVLLLMLANMTYYVVSCFREQKWSSGAVTFAIMLGFVYYMLYAWMLHAGGFW